MHKARAFFYVCAGLFLLALVPLCAPRSAQAQGYAYVLRWGTNGTGNGQFNYPSSVATDGSGNVYVADARFCPDVG